jgi:hypothetical protein
LRNSDLGVTELIFYYGKTGNQNSYSNEENSNLKYKITKENMKNKDVEMRILCKLKIEVSRHYLL